MSKERTYEFKVDIETISDVIWFVNYDVLIVNGNVIDKAFTKSLSFSEEVEFRKLKVSDYKLVEFENGKVVALVQTEEEYF